MAMDAQPIVATGVDNLVTITECEDSGGMKRSLEPRLTFGGRGKRAWYTLSAHAPKFPEILGIRIFVRLSIRKCEP